MTACDSERISRAAKMNSWSVYYRECKPLTCVIVRIRTPMIVLGNSRVRPRETVLQSTRAKFNFGMLQFAI